MAYFLGYNISIISPFFQARQPVTPPPLSCKIPFLLLALSSKIFCCLPPLIWCMISFLNSPEYVLYFQSINIQQNTFTLTKQNQNILFNFISSTVVFVSKFFSLKHRNYGGKDTGLAKAFMKSSRKKHRNVCITILNDTSRCNI